MVRVLLFATHVLSTNGYSYVGRNIARYLSKKDDIELTYWGFQHSYNIHGLEEDRKIPDNVQLIDALANEKVKEMGFGFNEVTDFVTMNKPDICIIFNDMVVVTNIIDKLNKVENKKFKIIVYADQVYSCQRKEHIETLNKHADFVICFTKYWEDCIKGQGMTVPTGVFEHGIDQGISYSIPKELARTYFNLNKDDFIIINSNRNQPRKRLDLMVIAFAEIVSRHMDDPIKLLISTAPVGAWNLLEIYERELKLRGVKIEDGMKHVIFVDNPQMLTDEDMNILYNTADVGLNTAMGEGFGLCNFQGGAIGIPQIVPNVGGFKDFFNRESAQLIEPKVNLYTDATVDGCPGLAEICDYMDFVEAIEHYYADDELRKKHSINGKKYILENYQWEPLVDKLYGYIKEVHGPSKENIVVDEKEIIQKLKSKLKLRR
jgi:glycosyltransferase involved in cell wall biosynthesis